MKQKAQKKCVIKIKLKIENYKNCVEATQLKNKTNHLEKNQVDTDSLNKNHKEFIRNNKSILKTQQRPKSERCNAFTEEIKKITLSSSDDERM